MALRSTTGRRRLGNASDRQAVEDLTLLPAPSRMCILLETDHDACVALRHSRILSRGAAGVRRVREACLSLCALAVLILVRRNSPTATRDAGIQL